MICNELNEKLDDFVDGKLPQNDRTAFKAHVEACAGCRQTVDNARRLRALLREYGAADAAQADAGFFDRALANAVHSGSRRERRQYWLKGFGSAIAAGLALFALVLLFLQAPDADYTNGVPGVTMALERPQTVNLVFASASALIDASLTIVLPDGINVAGFEGQREISWSTTLQAGKNVLPLRLVATSPNGGELLATLRHADDDRTFRLLVNVI